MRKEIAEKIEQQQNVYVDRDGKYQVIKTARATPGPQNQTVTPERDVVMSAHSRLDLAEKAKAKYERDHHGYANFRIEKN